MNKYVIELRPDCKVVQEICESDGQLYIGSKSLNYFEELNADYINEHFKNLLDDTYDKGYEDGCAVSFKPVSNVEYQRGFEDGKWKSEDGCTGCKYEGKTGEHLPCDYCMNNFKNQWTAKDDKIEVGDEVKAEDGTVVFFVTWMSDRCICGVDKEGKCYSYEPKEICGKTGRHFDIILEEKKA